MRTDLSQAEPMSEEIETFESLRSYAGKLFRISNIGLVERPAWQYRLL
jgi:aspartate aminotransferase-like enzyme